MSTEVASPVLVRSDRILLILSVALTFGAGFAHYGEWNSVLRFLLAAAAVAVLASVVGHSVDQLGDRFGPGATGVLQSALGNLPELFICIFSLKAGLVDVVRAALVGSILANLLLVLGLAFVAGGLRHGTQQLGSARARTITVLMLLSVTAMSIPSVAHWIHTPASEHEDAFSLIVSVLLLVLFALNLPASLRRDPDEARPVDEADPGDGTTEPEEEHEHPRWPVWLAIGMLAAASLLAAFVSEWFVDALQPAMDSMHISQAFAGLVVVAIAGNAVENVVGIQLAASGRSAYAFAVVLNSPIQISLVLAPLLVLISQIAGFATLTLVFSPMLVAVLMLSVVLAAFIYFDGESNWLEGATLVVLYGIIATAFWWG
ncbi:calcium/proton exchanger [Mycobacterium intermedium]|uniref:Ca(2+)/H(+) antiporter n=1 Tax=Mycobacterium intermedium TaxID=28445 RepID=A0A1E3SAB9_MYCIE|nr:calcium/proton exchanger [Mycobacterium intermedium]MCV6967515.1 calcium/proton exchanger [Mycobacterium intermedium]ODQ99093.1 calcium/proton exchanger [Mycobacterium intermedium]OPE49146.1 calcium/proton exchanger [Mycobacterium intermedium]ORA97513.1 calcium/proton exchanger [Mycobacterium intermedium]